MEKNSMKIKDMTKGNAMLIIIQFAIPLFIGNLFQQIYIIADTMVAGYTLGDSAIAAIGSTSSSVFVGNEYCMGIKWWLCNCCNTKIWVSETRGI